MTGPETETLATTGHETGAKAKTAGLLQVRIEHLWCAIPFLLLIWISSLLPLPAFDFWWHLKSGQIILESGAIPSSDTFSYTAAGKTYLLQNWLAEVLFYLVYRAGGPALIITFNTLLLLATLVPVYIMCRRHADGLRAGVLASGVAAFALAFQGTIRPQVLSFLIFAWFYFILVEYRDRRRNLIWLLPLLMALWVNLHGGFVLGIALIVLWMGLDLVPGGGGRHRRNEVAKLAVVLLVTVGATLLNPQMIGVYQYVREVANDPVSHRYVVEWRSPEIGVAGDVLRFFGPFFLGLFILTVSKKRPMTRDVVLFMAFAVFALTARRNSAWFAIIAAPLLAPHIHWRLDSGVRAIVAGRSRVLNLLVAVLLLAATILNLPSVQSVRSRQSEDLRLLDARLPVKAADFVARKKLAGRIFHPQDHGDYLIWRLWPQHRTFFDGRVHLFPAEVAEDYFTILHGEPGWEAVAAKYRVDYLLLARNEAKQRTLSDSARKGGLWKLLYEDERSLLLERNAGLN